MTALPVERAVQNLAFDVNDDLHIQPMKVRLTYYAQLVEVRTTVLWSNTAVATLSHLCPLFVRFQRQMCPISAH